MAVTELFSKRQKKLRGEQPDVYQYDDIPTPLRVQTVHMLGSIFGEVRHTPYNSAYDVFKEIHDTLCLEYGILGIRSLHCPYFAQWANPEFDDLVYGFILDERTDTDKVLDVVELAYRAVEKKFKYNKPNEVLAAISELNTRFREQGVGYQYESGSIVRVDSQFLHSEAVKPTLLLLSEKQYEGANHEFLKAFEYYRKSDTKGCLTECLKAFESTMKAICEKRKWSYSKTDTAKALIETCFQNNLIPQLLQSHIGSLRAGLESGIPTVRNKLSAHGQGPHVEDVPEYYASYLLHLTATTIQLLVNAEKGVK